MSTTPPPIRTRPLIANQQAIIWGVFTFLGAVAISLTNANAPLRSTILLLMMLAYTLLGMRLRSERNDLPDSVYFMGFIWSVWVLVVGTAFQKGSGPIGVNKLQELFGYSLATTGAGMFIRVLLMQTDPTNDLDATPSTTKDATELLIRSTTRTAARLDDLANRFELASNRLVDSLDGTAERFRRVTDGAAAEASEAIKIHVTAAAKNVQRSLEAPIPQSQALGEAIGDAARRLTSSADSLQASLELVQKTVTNFTKETQGQWTNAGKMLTEGASQTQTAARGLAESAGNLDGMNKSIRQLTNDLAKLTQATSELIDVTRRIHTESVSSANNSMVHAHNAMANLAQAAVALQESVRAVANQHKG